MKKIITLVAVAILSTTAMFAQYSNAYGNSSSAHNDYQYGGYDYDSHSKYIGFRIGPAFSFVNSDDPMLDGSSTKTGLNLGVAVGLPLSDTLPLYFETGLYYTAKGGNGKYLGSKFKYNLNYLEVPLVFKYRHYFDEHFAIHPFIGVYAALGISGQIKDFGNKEAYSSFSSDNDNSFKRTDAGLKFGCGVSYDMLYAELGYDLGLSNICHDNFESSNNNCIVLNIGVNF